MRRDDLPRPLTIRETYSELTVDDLKPVAALVGQPPTRKNEIVDLLAKTLEDPKAVRGLYDGLADLSRKALQEATHDPMGVLDTARFEAKYGQAPNLGGSGRRYGDKTPPVTLRLFFPVRWVLPRDLRATLREFVPEPPPLTVNALDVLPPRLRLPLVDLGRYRGKPDEVEVEPRVRHTARAALRAVKAVLRLIDAGEVRVGDKTRRPSQAAMKAVAAVLSEGDFYSEDDQSKDDWDASSDLRIQAFAWPMLAQAAGLAEASGTRLQLTAAGRKATTREAHEVILQVWHKWQKTTLVDEFNRINAIKGQQSKGKGLTAVAGRRSAVVAVLRECPVQKWIAVDELFRLLKALARDFEVSHDEWKLYISELQYGSMADSGRYGWEMLEGRFTLAFLFEYAATLGLLDVAYTSPDGARNDFCGHWGTDDMSALSRYDGLLALRINALGAWCLGLADGYEPEVVAPERLLKILPNRDVVAADRPLDPADVLFLERFAERKSDAVWHLGPDKVLEAVEKGLTVQELKEFLGSRNQGPLPHTVEVFLDDLAKKTGQLEDLGNARLIACRDADAALLLAHDRRLRKLCQLAGDRQLVFRAADEPAVRRALKDLGYVLPPPR